MSRLRVFTETDGQTPLRVVSVHAEIAEALASYGVRFERWESNIPVADSDSSDSVMAAFAADIARLKAEGGYQAVDVVSLAPSHPQKDALRKKFLDEHTHSEDEVRFFVAGSGLFSLHLRGQVLEVLCEKGDLISVPAGTRHWFDMGPAPSFVAIRLFTNPAGWVANFTGSAIAHSFPRYETETAR